MLLEECLFRMLATFCEYILLAGEPVDKHFSEKVIDHTNLGFKCTKHTFLVFKSSIYILLPIFSDSNSDKYLYEK